MDIQLNLDRDFEEKIKKLKRKYGEKFEYLNGFHNNNLNFTEFIDNFTKTNTLADVTIDGNANANTKDVSSLVCDMVKPHTKLLGFNKVYYEIKKKYGKDTADDWLEAEWSGVFYMHNASDISLKGYCFAFDLEDVVTKGLFFNDGMPSKPAKHLSTYNEHVLQFVSYCSKLISGAVGLPNYLLYSYYFWKKDVENNYLGCREQAEKYRDQYFQSFIYNMNQTLLRVNQSAFTNVSIFDRNYYMELFGGKKFPDGTLMYKDCDDFIEYQKAFMRVIAKVRGEQYFTFPVLTYSLLFKDGKFVDENFAKWCITHNCIWYDANIYNSKSTDTISSCCRITNNTKEIQPFINSIGGTSLSVGSVVVNTLNLRRIALLCDKNENHYINRLEYYSKLSIKAMDCVRDIIKRNVEKGLLPIYKYDLIQMDKQFNTFGITAMYEAVREFGYIETDEFGNKYYTEDGIKFSSKIFDFLNEYRKSVPVDYPINIESVPGERANVILCEKDNEIFGNEFNDWIYSNQWIPLMEKCTIDEKIRLGSILDKQCGGGRLNLATYQK